LEHYCVQFCLVDQKLPKLTCVLFAIASFMFCLLLSNGYDQLLDLLNLSALAG